LRISDEDVDEVGEEALVDARGQVFMLFYERVGEYK
jgi:ubiquitin carboxyl-terminal hydrolase 1